MKHQHPCDKATLNVESAQVVLEKKEIPNSVLKRLIDEVRKENLVPATAYNRTHNRHNRGR